jgi:NADH dehydrogenase [ubiquinone] 1 alpha subcomplex assembly factor 7
MVEVLGSGEASRGSALIVDYGGNKAYADSFRVSTDIFHTKTVLTWCYQAFKDHKIMDVFHRPGECDLTANVDFAYLKEAFAGLGTTARYVM